MLWTDYLLYNLATPVSISHFWSMGFTAGIFFTVQFVTGLLLSLHFTSSGMLTIMNMTNDLNFGETIRLLHATGASILFLVLYLHLLRGLYKNSYLLPPVWNTGVILFLLFVGTAFLGYAIPWTQMSFWAATVITNLITALPIWGEQVAIFVWGDFSVSLTTATRFYSLHFLLPFVILAMIMFHIFFLHLTHSQNPISQKGETIKFFPFFWLKDMTAFSTIMILFLVTAGWLFLLPQESEMFVEMNQVVAPEHIVPEWYFLPFYAVLRCVPSKIGGVILMLGVFLIAMALPLRIFTKSNSTLLVMSIKMISLFSFLLLFWVGGLPVVFPFDWIGKLVALVFFSSFILI